MGNGDTYIVAVTTVTVEGDATLDVTISSTTDLVALNASTVQHHQIRE